MATHKIKRLNRLLFNLKVWQNTTSDPETVKGLEEDIGDLTRQIADENFRSRHPALHAEREKRKREGG